MLHRTFPRPLRASAGVALALFLIARAQPTWADDDLPDSALRLSGFGTVGVVHANAPANWGFLRNIDQPPNNGGTRADTDSRLGVQANYDPTAQFELVGQVVATRRAVTANETDAITWAFAGWRPNADTVIRIGRLNLDLFLISDYRNVGFAYAYARPPVEFYSVIPSSLDGIDATHTWDTDSAMWRTKIFAGRAKALGIDVTPGYGVSVTREAGKLTLRGGFSRGRTVNPEPFAVPVIDALSTVASLPVPPVAQQAVRLRGLLDSSGSPVIYSALGANYEPRDWIWTAEALHVGGSPVYAFSAGYLTGGRRFGPVTVFGTASAARGNEASMAVPSWGAALEPFVGPSLAGQVQAVAIGATDLANVTIDQRTFSAGARWDVLPRVDIKAQFDRVHVNMRGGSFWANANLAGGSANVGSLLVDFIF